MSSFNFNLNDSIFDMKYPQTVSALSNATIRGDLKEIRRLLSKKKSPHIADNRGWTAVHYAAASNQYKSLKLILKLQFKNRKHLVNLTTFENLTPLFIAIKYSSPLEIISILLKCGANPRVSPHTNLSPLHLACLRKGNIKLVKLLVQYGADVNAKDDLTNSTPLHFAVNEAKDIEIIQFLIKLSDLTMKNSNNRTAFMESVCSNFTESVKLFVECDRNLVNSEDYVPPLACAGYLGNLEMTTLLLESQANVNMMCKALVTDPEKDSFGILLDSAIYLPIHSSLTNVLIFKKLLLLTSAEKIEELPSSYCNFPLFVLFNSNDVTIYEALLKSNLPERLKTISYNNLVNFIINCSWEMTLIEQKFRLCLRYNLNIEPDIVFSSLINYMRPENVKKYLKLLFKLAEIGISSKCSPFIKLKAFEILKNFELHHSQSSEDRYLASETRKLVISKSASLKQLSRQVVRKVIYSFAKTNWLSYKIIRSLDLPRLLIKYLLFEE